MITAKFKSIFLELQRLSLMIKNDDCDELKNLKTKLDQIIIAEADRLIPGLKEKREKVEELEKLLYEDNFDS